MGLPEGHVTGEDLGLTREQQLRLLGNGVVPHQGAAAIYQRIIDPLKGLGGVREFQERARVLAVRLTRENAATIAKIARKSVEETDDELYIASDNGVVVLVEADGAEWAREGDMIVARPGSMRLSNRIPEDFLAWYTKPGEQLTEEDLG